MASEVDGEVRSLSTSIGVKDRLDVGSMTNEMALLGHLISRSTDW